MTCPSCHSIWMRPTLAPFITEGDASWTRRFDCGGCGGIFMMRITRIGNSMTDTQKKQMEHEVPGTLTVAVMP